MWFPAVRISWDKWTSTSSYCTLRHSKFLAISAQESPTWELRVSIACFWRPVLMDQSPINQNFYLNKSRQNSIIAWKSITKLVIFQNFVAKCCQMRVIYSFAKFAIFSHFWLRAWNGYHFSKILISTSLNKNFITAWKSITKLVIFQSFVAKCCKMRII